jgi:hypothetical protein
MTGLRWSGKIIGVMLALGLLVLLPKSTIAPAQSTSHGSQTGGTGHPSMPTNEIQGELPQPLSVEQKQSIMRANFERSKTDAEELAELAKGLREFLDKSPHNLPSGEIILRAEKIEKLAKKIRDETKGF